jgi:hypothetical protein
MPVVWAKFTTLRYLEALLILRSAEHGDGQYDALEINFTPVVSTLHIVDANNPLVMTWYASLSMQILTQGMMQDGTAPARPLVRGWEANYDEDDDISKIEVPF